MMQYNIVKYMYRELFNNCFRDFRLNSDISITWDASQLAYSYCFLSLRPQISHTPYPQRPPYLPSPTQHPHSSCKMFRRYVSPTSLTTAFPRVTMDQLSWHGGLRSALAKQAFRLSTRPAVSNNVLRASAARFASTDSALKGKIHQVIGAIVDGK